MNILHLDSSPRGERSHSRHLTRIFVEELQTAQPNAQVVYRDLGHNPPPHVDEMWIAAAYSDPATHTPELKAALSTSDELVDELFASDVIVIGAPMYNFSIPAMLKAYIDQIVRAGRTFATFQYPVGGGLVHDKKLFVLTARGGGGYGMGEPWEGADFQAPYLKAIFGVIGITDITFVHDEKTLSGDSNLPDSLLHVRQAAREAANSMS